MPGGANLIVEARAALLDAVLALRAHRDSIILVGAQAIYLRTGHASFALAESTKDSDLAVTLRACAEARRERQVHRPTTVEQIESVLGRLISPSSPTSGSRRVRQDRAGSHRARERQQDPRTPTAKKWMSRPVRRVLSRTSVAGWCGGGHPSRPAIADRLQHPTRALDRAGLERALSGLAPGGVYRAAPVTWGAGGLLHHRFTLTSRGWRSVFCGTVPRVTPGGCWPPPCPVEPGRSSAGPKP